MTPRKAFQLQLWSFRFGWRLDKLGTVLFMFRRVFHTLNAILATYLFGRIIDVMVAASNNTRPIEDLLPFLLVIGLSNLGGRLVNVFFSWQGSNLDYRRSIKLYSEYRRQLYKLGIQTLELPDVKNTNIRAEQELSKIWTSADNVINITQYLIEIVSSIFVVLAYVPIAVPIILILAILRFIPDRKLTRDFYSFDLQHTEYRRFYSTDAGVLDNTNTLLEVRSSSLFDFFFGRWLSGRKFMMDGYQSFRLNAAKWGAVLSFFEVGLNAFVTWTLALALLAGQLSIGGITFAISMVNKLNNGLDALLFSLTSIYETSTRLTDVKKFFELEPVILSGDIEMEDLKSGPEIKFDNVDFAYPGSEKLIIKNLNLDIRSGERIAIVGENGAGKTTLTKMIMRIYDPKSGSITVNGKDLKSLSLDSWYKNVGILQQEFNHFGHLSAKQNIALGDISKPLDEGLIRQAARMADADGFIQEYPQGYDQILSEAFTGGIRPSTGQKQKLAIARFFYRNSPLIIFDEPTAAIDAVSEYNIFNKIYSFFAGKTVIIISHRFSTVRNADRILVMDHGEVVEQGSHSELMAMNGKYANAFKLQAEGYQS